jgi:hypothetical protein
MTVVSMGNKGGRAWAAIAIVPICGLCGWRSAQLGLGESPDSAPYHYKRWQSQPERSEELDGALALNPRYTAAWIARGLAAEMAGNHELAENSLLQASATDRMYLPAWTLANFYLRADDRPRFWIWARRAAAMAYDPGALFQLFWRVSGDPQEILEQAIPPTLAVRRAYLDFLLRTNRFEAAGALAQEIGRMAAASDLDLLLRYCDTALARRQWGAARAVWGSLSRAGLVPHQDDSPLTNGDLAKTPLGRGFDWRSSQVAGASVSFDPDSRALLVSLSGKQPETFNLVEQYLALKPGARYRFGFQYRTHDLPPESGLVWSFVEANTGLEFAASAVPISQGGWNEQVFEFSTSKGCGLGQVLLRYHRPAGSVRAEGSVDFSRFTLEAGR